MRRTTGYDPSDDLDDPRHEPTPSVHRISTTPGAQRQRSRGEIRRLSTTRRAPQRRGPDPRVWFVRGSIGIAALAGLWLGLQAMFPMTESRVSETPTASRPIDAIAVGAPEPPPGQAVAAQPAPAEAAAPTQGQEPAAGAPQAVAAQPAPQAAQPEPTAIPDRLPGLPAPAAQAAPPAAPVAQAKPNNEAPAQQPVGKPTLAPIPPPPNPQPNAAPASTAEQQAAQAAQQAQAAAAPKPQAPAPAAKAQAAPPAAPSGSGAFELAASASPSNPISEQAMVTISVKATQNGAPLAGASCMATVYFRTATIKQPNGGFATNGNGVASFTLDAKGSTYGHYIPVDVTCTGRNGTVTARTGFTPVKGR